MPVKFEHLRLDNGLTILGEVNPDAHTTAVGYFVKTGARDEPRGWMGVSHFLEHMVFKGTARRSTDDVNREFDEMGAEYNAFTGQEATVFYAQVLPEFVPQALDLLTDVMRPALRPGDFEMERKVILEEIAMYEDRPQWRLNDALMEAHFGNHPLAHRVLGTTGSVGGLSSDDMRRYWQERYVAGNVGLVVAGRANFAELAADVSRLTAEWGRGSPGRNDGVREPAAREISVRDPKLSRHYLGMMAAAPSAQHRDRHAARVLAEVLGSGDGSRLYWELVDPGLAEEADLSHYGFDGVGAYAAFVTCDPAQGDRVERVLRQTLKECARGMDVDEVERAKNKLATDCVIPTETPLGRLRDVGSNWLYLNRYVSLEEDVRQLMETPLQEVRSLAEQLVAAPLTVVRLGPDVS